VDVAALISLTHVHLVGSGCGNGIGARFPGKLCKITGRAFKPVEEHRINSLLTQRPAERCLLRPLRNLRRPPFDRKVGFCL